MFLLGYQLHCFCLMIVDCSLLKLPFYYQFSFFSILSSPADKTGTMIIKIVNLVFFYQQSNICAVWILLNLSYVNLFISLISLLMYGSLLSHCLRRKEFCCLYSPLHQLCDHLSCVNLFISLISM
jgi:hypothetical protein